MKKLDARGASDRTMEAVMVKKSLDALLPATLEAIERPSVMTTGGNVPREREGFRSKAQEMR
jgi:hypothetical protein